MDINPQQVTMPQHVQQQAPPPKEVKDLGIISHPLEFVNRKHSNFQTTSKLTQYAANSKEFHLELLSQPLHSIAIEWTGETKPRSHKKRKSTDWPLEPPPVIALRIVNGSELEYHNALTACPNVFCLATLTNVDGHPVSSEYMRGRHSSSLIKLDKAKSPALQTDHAAIGVFLFDQIHIRFPGQYCLLFTLFEMQMHDQGMHAVVHNVVRSSPFTVLPQPKRLPKPNPPSDILLALAAQGAKIKIRKPNEERAKKRPDWSIDPNEHDLSHHAPMLPSFHGHAQHEGLPISMPASMYIPPPMPITHAQYASLPAPQMHPAQQMFMQPEFPQEIHFSGMPDPTQPFMFGAQYPQTNNNSNNNNHFNGGYGGGF